MYALGKTLTYGVLGAIVGLIGHGIMSVAPGQQALALLVGALLLVMGLATAGVLPDRWAMPSRLTAWMGAVLTRVRGAGRIRGPFLLGLVNGFLPCGLVYAALLASAQQGSPVPAAVGMLAFGVATLPALGLVAVGTDLLTPGRRRWVTRAGGWLVVVFALVTLWRGLSPPMMH